MPADEVPDHDVLLGGFPCQPFSIAGVSKKNALGRPHGFADETQGTLFFDVARIIDAKRPRAFMLENVRNLMSHDKGQTIRVIMRTLHRGTRLSRAGPGAGCLAAGARRVGKRIFIVGFAEDTGFDFGALEFPASRPTMSDVLHPEDGSEDPETPYTEGPRAQVADKYTLTDHLWPYLQNYAAKHRSAGNGFGYGLVGPDDVARTLSARYYKDGSEILVSRGGRDEPSPAHTSRVRPPDGLPGHVPDPCLRHPGVQAVRQQRRRACRRRCGAAHGAPPGPGARAGPDHDLHVADPADPSSRTWQAEPRRATRPGARPDCIPSSRSTSSARPARLSARLRPAGSRPTSMSSTA